MGMPRLFKLMVFQFFAKNFVAGETVEDAIRVAKGLEKKGIYAIINILGEHVKDYNTCIYFRDQYLKLIHELSENRLGNTHISIKPSQLGLEISDFFYRMNLEAILQEMSIYLPESLLEIDAETHDYREGAREASLDFAQAFPGLQRMACQLNRNESSEEIEQFIKAGISVRLCKGTAYPGDIKKGKELRKRFLEQALLLSKKGHGEAVATHDLYLIDRLKDSKNLEFQVLLGIENEEMEKLSLSGKKVGFYVPCGPNWWPYGKRRGKAIVGIGIRNWWYRIMKGGR